MKKNLSLVILLFALAIGSMKAQYYYPMTSGADMKMVQNLYNSAINSIKEVYYFRDANNVACSLNPGTGMFVYKDGSAHVVLYVKSAGNNNAGERIYKAENGNIRMVRTNSGNLILNTPHSNGDVTFRPCTESEYKYAMSHSNYTDKRFSNDMKNVYQLQGAAHNSSSSSGSSYGSSSSSNGSQYSYLGSTSALKITLVSSRLNSTSYETVELYRSAYDGSTHAKAGGFGPAPASTNTNSSFMGVNVQGLRYFIVVPGNGVHYYYFFNN